MIKRMRYRVIGISTGAMAIVLLVIFLTINQFMRQVTLKQVDSFLRDVANHNGKILEPRRPKHEGPIQKNDLVEGFSITLSEHGELMSVFLTSEYVSIETIEALIPKIDLSSDYIKNIDDYRYIVKPVEAGYLAVGADTSVQNGMMKELIRISYVIGAISFVIILLMIIILSKYITKPVEVAFEKQKRFIADSSHELKTPLSIISANLDMLEMEIGENNRINAMSRGIKRMNKLIHELLLLARTEQQQIAFIPFDLSKVMESTILPLEVIAYEDGKEIEMTIEDGVVFKGDEEAIRKMIGALMENAIKYSRQNTIIKASLHKKGDNKIIEIYNEGIGVTKEQKERLFDKFYRVDNSRSKETGGHGIGLSIVKNIVDMHKGKILVDSIPNEYIVFKVVLH